MTEPTPTPEESGQKPVYKRWWFITLVALVLLIAVASLGDDAEAPSETTLLAAETTTTVEPTATTSAATTPTTTSADTISTTSTTSTSTTSTTTTTVPEPEAAFGSGTWLVGPDIDPGIYQTAAEATTCYWERLSGLSGDFDDIIANENVVGQGIVEILGTDEAFSSTRCGDWIELTTLDEPLSSFGDGWYAVGPHIAPGRYRSTGGDFCYWARLSGFSGEFSDLSANDIVEGQTLVDIGPNDAGFQSSGCGTFEPVG